MKKMWTFVLSAALLLASLSLAVLNTAAEEIETSFKFGNATVELTLIDNFNEGQGNTFQNWGVVASDGEMLKFELGGLPCNDSYNVKTGMLNADTDFTGAVNLVFSVKDNRSDGDLFFAFQPHSVSLDANEGNLFTGWVEGETVWLVDEKGKATEAKKCPSVDLMSGRAGYILPMGFEGYIVFPVGNLVRHGDWANPYYTDGAKPDFDGLGFHIAKDDATYAELSLDDFFICGELPAYEKPTPETKPVETQPETMPETVAETVAETQATAETTAGTIAETAADPVQDTAAVTEAPEKKGGCGAVMGGLCILPLVILGAVAIRRRED